MGWKDLLKEDKGLGDTVSRITKRMGIRECGGCKKRKAYLNKLLKYNGYGFEWPSSNWTLHLFVYHKHGYDNIFEEERKFTGTFDEAKFWAVEEYDRYDTIHEGTEKLYGGSGFSLEDENGREVLTDKDV